MSAAEKGQAAIRSFCQTRASVVAGIRPEHEPVATVVFVEVNDWTEWVSHEYPNTRKAITQPRSGDVTLSKQSRGASLSNTFAWDEYTIMKIVSRPKRFSPIEQILSYLCVRSIFETKLTIYSMCCTQNSRQETNLKIILIIRSANKWVLASSIIFDWPSVMSKHWRFPVS